MADISKIRLENQDYNIKDEYSRETLNIKPFSFNTVDEMKSNTNLINNTFVKTSGKNTYDDGLGGFYKIRTKTDDDIIDNINIIQLTSDETLIAELIKNNEIINLDEKIDDVNNNLDNKINKVDDKYATYFNNLSRDNVDFYVDGNDGDDSNDGSENSPFKTFDRFLQEYYRYNEIRCHFIGSKNTYDMNSIETFNSIRYAPFE